MRVELQFLYNIVSFSANYQTIIVINNYFFVLWSKIQVSLGFFLLKQNNKIDFDDNIGVTKIFIIFRYLIFVFANYLLPN